MNRLTEFFKNSFNYYINIYLLISSLVVKIESKPVVSSSYLSPKVHLYLLSSAFLIYRVNSARL